jgi:hypothetical protein
MKARGSTAGVDGMLNALREASGSPTADVVFLRASSSLRRAPVTLIEATEQGDGFALKAVIVAGRLRVLVRDVLGSAGVRQVKDVAIWGDEYAAFPITLGTGQYVLLVAGESWPGNPGTGENIQEVDRLAQAAHEAFLNSAGEYARDQSMTPLRMRTREDR